MPVFREGAGMKISVFAVLAFVLAAPAHAQPCMVADASCKESLAIGQFSFWYFRSYSLQMPNPEITRAVIVMLASSATRPIISRQW
jgi:hypothetical protein